MRAFLLRRAQRAVGGIVGARRSLRREVSRGAVSLLLVAPARSGPWIRLHAAAQETSERSTRNLARVNDADDGDAASARESAYELALDVQQRARLDHGVQRVDANCALHDAARARSVGAAAAAWSASRAEADAPQSARDTLLAEQGVRRMVAAQRIRDDSGAPGVVLHAQRRREKRE
jgi:hypothetical protein